MDESIAADNARRAEDIIKGLEQTDAKAVKQAREVEQALTNAQQAAARAADAAARLGVTQEAIHFSRLAERYFWSSIFWLGFAVGFGLLTYIYAVTHLTQSPSGDVAALARFMIPRLVVISLFLTGLLFCLRNFGACSHNQTVNRHKATALSTFQTFVSGAGGDADTKNAVLLQATRAIFLPQPSGFLKGEADAPQFSQVTEVVRDFTEKAKG
jgi:hypothetical protein